MHLPKIYEMKVTEAECSLNQGGENRFQFSSAYVLYGNYDSEFLDSSITITMDSEWINLVIEWNPWDNLYLLWCKETSVVVDNMHHLCSEILHLGSQVESIWKKRSVCRKEIYFKVGSIGKWNHVDPYQKEHPHKENNIHGNNIHIVENKYHHWKGVYTTIEISTIGIFSKCKSLQEHKKWYTWNSPAKMKILCTPVILKNSAANIILPRVTCMFKMKAWSWKWS